MSVTSIYDLQVRLQGLDQLKALEQYTTRTTAALKGANENVKNFNRSAAGMKTAFGGGTQIQQVGFQIQDFAVQVAAGTSAAQAFGQQAPQLLSAFGPLGAVVGTLAAVLVPLGAAFLSSGKEAVSLSKSVDTTKTATEELTKSVELLAASLGTVKTGAIEKELAKIGQIDSFLKQQTALDALKSQMQSVGAEISNQISYYTSMQIAMGNVTTALGGVSRGLISLEPGFTSFRGSLTAVTDGAQNIATLTAGLTSMGVEANTAFKIAVQLNNAMNSTSASEYASGMATARDALLQVYKAGGSANSQLLTIINSINQGIPANYEYAKSVAVMAASLQSLAGTAAGMSFAPMIDQTAVLPSHLKNVSTEIANARKEAESFWTVANNSANAKAVANIQSLQPPIVGLKNQLKELEAAKAQFGAGWSTEQMAAADRAIAGVNERIASMSKAIGGGGKGKKGGAGGGVGAADALQSFKDQLSGMSPEAQRISEEIRKMEENFAKFKDSLTPEEIINYNAKLGDMKAKLEQAGQAASEAAPGMKSFADSVKEAAEQIPDMLASGLTDALMSIIDGTKSAKEAFADFAKSVLTQITQMIIKMTIMAVLQKTLGGLFGGIGFSNGGAFQNGMQLYAKGASFRSGSVKKFASGGVSAGPTFFPMAGGRTGLMGEAGPEAIMPLTRRNGRLGVESSPVNVVVNNNSDAAVRIRQERDRTIVDIAIQELTGMVARGGNGFDRALQGSYGMRRSGR